jgi:hypothetical protein
VRGDHNTMTVTTVAPASTLPSSPPAPPPTVALFFWLAALVAPIALMTKSPRRKGGNGTSKSGRRSLAPTAALATLGAILLLASVSCGDDGAKPPSGGTPAGSYDLTVTATWESVQVTTTVTMVVQ